MGGIFYVHMYTHEKCTPESLRAVFDLYAAGLSAGLMFDLHASLIQP